jgi:hypothetical protein
LNLVSGYDFEWARSSSRLILQVIKKKVQKHETKFVEENQQKKKEKRKRPRKRKRAGTRNIYIFLLGPTRVVYIKHSSFYMCLTVYIILAISICLPHHRPNSSKMFPSVYFVYFVYNEFNYCIYTVEQGSGFLRK